MKRLLLGTSLLVMALSSATALAGGGKKGHGKHDKHDRDRTHQAYRRDDRRDDDRHHDDDRRYDYRDGRHDNGRHLGWQKQAFRRGQRVPAAYLEPRYYVQDYRAYRLSAPPSGHRWVRPHNDDRYLLVQTATGLISQMLGY